MCLLDIYKVAPVVVAMCLPPPPPWCRDITQAIAISSPDTRIVEDAVGETCTSDDECLPLAWPSNCVIFFLHVRTVVFMYVSVCV